MTFGPIAALLGLDRHLIDEVQYAELVTVVILSTFIPTIVAQQFFQSKVAIGAEMAEEEEALGEGDVWILRRRKGPRQTPPTPPSG